MNELFVQPLKRSKEFKEAKKNLKEGACPFLINGMLQSQKSNMTYGLFKDMKTQCMIVTHSDLEAKAIYEDLKFYGGDKVFYLPTEEIFFYSLDARDRSEDKDIVNLLYSLSLKEDIIIVSSLENLLKKYMPQKEFKKNIFTIEYGKAYSVQEIVGKLVAMGYERESKVEGMGQFSIRGGILDIFSCNYPNPLRIEFFDDEVDSIRFFSTMSQKSVEKVQEASVIPARQMLYPSDMKDPLLRIKSQLNKNSNEDLKSEIGKIESGIYLENLENYIDFLYDDEDKSILSHMKKNSLVIMSEPTRINEKEENYSYEFRENFETNLGRGRVLPTHGELLYSLSIMEDFFEGKKLLYYSLFEKSAKGFACKSIIEMDGREIPSFNGKMEMFFEELKFLKKKRYKTVISLGSENRAVRLMDILREEGFSPVLAANLEEDYKKQDLVVLVGDLSSGFRYESAKYALITDKEIYGSHKKTQRKKKKYKGRKIESFLELEVGDHVVHESHGIGKYIGIEQLKVDGLKKDYMKLMYSGTDSLYVPIEQLDKVQKYIGSNAERVKLNKMGSNEWNKVKTKTRKEIEDMARELIELYSTREKIKGYAYNEDGEWQREFESLFPFEETEDQEKAIIEVKKDMESQEIMDRLVCGDVGYGKTEVAIRAVFKACMDSKQVAFLVPTTILAQQHYDTFKKRFEKFPIRVEVISRFKTPKQQKQIIEDINLGLVDVVIGTHRILSKDLKFKDLGLLVIDEEQRFGVKHKEALKQFKKSVDVLAMSATPIPRTLHMSLSGIRNLSIIDEPPEERHPVLTYVVEGKESIMADAIEREIARGGQVFFVYNRVESIEKMAATIQKLVPDARIGLGHGQMSSRQLEKVMFGFMDKEYDVLVCTTIIETGMDISNANTIIIHDADKMGLSQLYQLRGRVGRSSRQGYAYFMYEKDKALSEVSEKRLKAIKEFTEFGAGFKIAMRDLEIRGAGSILGGKQHGHMATIGYDLYVKMLDESIRKLKGMEIEEVIDTEIDLKLNAYIPDDYIADEKDKIDIYKKIALIGSKQDLLELEEEIEDRFSDIPLPVRTILLVGYMKHLGKQLNIKSIKHLKDMIFFEPHMKFKPREESGYKLAVEIVSELEKKVQLFEKNKA